MKTDITIQTTLPIFRTNLAELALEVDRHLEKYEGFVVTPENLADSKKLATELNKSAGVIDTRRKEAKKQASAPIDEMDAECRAVAKKFLDLRGKIVSQIEAYELETRAKIEEMLLSLRNRLWLDEDVDEEFQKADVEGMLLLGNITPKGELTSKAKAEMVGRVAADKTAMMQVNMRLMALENESLKAGLKAPLTRAHVEGILFASDSQYAEGLSRVITAELSRQEATLKAAEEEMLAKQAVEQKATVAAVSEDKTPPSPSPMPAASAPEPSTVPGKRSWRCNACFDILAPEAVDEARVIARINQLMERAGIKDLVEVSATCVEDFPQ